MGTRSARELSRSSAFSEIQENVTNAVHVKGTSSRIQDLNEATHVRALVMMRQVHGERDICNSALHRMSLVANLHGIAQIFHAYAIYGDAPMVPFALGVAQLHKR